MTYAASKKRVIGFIGWLAVVAIAAGIGSTASVQSSSFYAELARPSWAPPGAVFGPVWSVLYALIGIAAWLVWRAKGFRAGAVPLTFFLVQLALNALWTWLFFAWRLGSLAFVNIVVLWLLIAITLVLFWRVRQLAGVLLVPYLLWVSFATALCYTVWQLNPQVFG